MPEHHFKIARKYEKQIRDGYKTVEGRLNRGNALRVRVGDILVLRSVRVRVAHIEQYSGFKALLENAGLENVLPGVWGALRDTAF